MPAGYKDCGLLNCSHLFSLLPSLFLILLFLLVCQAARGLEPHAAGNVDATDLSATIEHDLRREPRWEPNPKCAK